MGHETRFARAGDVRMAHWRAGRVGAPVVVCLHGWPETKLIWERTIDPLADAGFDVIVPDLRGFGETDSVPDGFHDIVSHASDIAALVFAALGCETATFVGGDLGGPVAQEVALRHPDRVEGLVLFNCPLPFDKERMSGMRTRAPRETADYFIRQGTDADALATELSSPAARRAYIARFYGDRNWAHPGAFAPEDVEHHVEPFADATRLRATFANYEAAFDPAKRCGRPLFGPNDIHEVLVMFGTSDAVIYPDFDLMAAAVFSRVWKSVRIDGCGHFVPWEQPRRFTEETVSFLSRSR
ncbi:MAG: alpha/beta hydrolase [Actinobacteria bacterium]|nr:alpha/beta hydrolase [Actinomycetota bacterium]